MEKILILDFGSQYTQLIARRIRDSRVYCEIFPYNANLQKIREFHPRGLILSGGPASVFAEGAPHPDRGIFDLGIPILGICYGMQLLAEIFAGKVNRAAKHEYGQAQLYIDNADELFAGVSSSETVWMSHGDKIDALPGGFVALAYTDNAPIAAMADRQRRLYALQFHPEVNNTVDGKKILGNFVHAICGCSSSWQMSSFISTKIQEIRERVGKDRVICAVSGGVDSTTMAVLIHEAIGEQLACIFVDQGLLRKGEREQVESILAKFQIPLITVDASERFVDALAGVEDPEKKRKIIGHEFIAVFEAEAKRIANAHFLAQGTLYPDVIESISFKGPSAVIKSHHNVGGLPENLDFELIEPFRELFKDEVREIAHELGIPEEIYNRQPFPGPGLAVRCMGAVTRERLAILRDADAIVREEIERSGLHRSIWQYFAVFLPVKSVGVMGDSRTYDYVIAIRAVDSRDGMTADWSRIPHQILQRIANRIINEVAHVNRVVYDITSKPPGTIEWE